jgi:hypothetical protein
MSASDELLGDPLGLGHSWPRPGWVVLDAVRETGLTGEVRLETDPGARFYAERGRIYFAEKKGQAWIGARLVDAGAMTAAELERGTVRVDDVDHLGRLFDRVPSLDRHAAMVWLELMVDEVLAWIATQTVAGVVTMPYVHHPSGIHRWYAPVAPGAVLLSPGHPLPAPDPREEPVSEAAASTDAVTDAPMASFTFGEPFEHDDDDFGIDLRIEWADFSQPLEPPPSEPTPAPEPPAAPETAADAPSAAPVPAPPAVAPVTSAPPAVPAPPAAVPAAPTEPAAASAAAAAATADDSDEHESERALAAFTSSVDLLDRFEVVWPTGEVDDPFPPPTPAPPPEDLPVDQYVDRHLDHHVDHHLDHHADHRADHHVDHRVDDTDDVILAVRRAIAAIEMTFATETQNGEQVATTASSTVPQVGSPASGSADAALWGSSAEESERATGAGPGGWNEIDPWEQFEVRESPLAFESDARSGMWQTPGGEGSPAAAPPDAAMSPALRTPPPPPPPRAGVSEGRRSALRRLIDGIRKR